MRYAFIRAHAGEYPVQRLCAVLQVSRAGYYAWCQRGTQPASARQQANTALVEQIRAIHAASRTTYGSPRVHAELQARGVRCGKHRVARLMRMAHLQGLIRHRRRVRTTDSAHAYVPAPNVLARRFREVRDPNTVWAADITYIPTVEGWVYLAAVLDVASRRVIGWAMHASLERHLTLDALRMALLHRRPKRSKEHQLLHHSDRGSQYACTEYQQLLQQHGLTASMSRRGNCYDNAIVESLFATFKTELLDRCAWQTHAEVRHAVFEYIEVWYNRQRRHSSLGYRSPAEYESLVQQAPATREPALVL